MGLSALGILLLIPCLVRAQARTVAMTVDDLPFAPGNSELLTPADASRAVEVNEAILRAFRRHRVPATGFVIGRRAEELGIPASRKILKRWIQPGFALENHLYSHPDVNTLSLEQVQQEITRGEDILAPLLESVSRKPAFLRFPYNHTGDTKEKHDAIAAFMSARGYRLAPCTIDGSDYEFNAAYVLALARHENQTAAQIRAAYIRHTGAEIDWYTALNKQVFGYEPPHIMLLHDNALNADALSDLLSLFEQRGYSFVSLADAMKDPAYAIPETYVTKYGPMWGYRWAQELHVKVNGRNEPEPPAWVSQYIKEHSAAQ